MYVSFQVSQKIKTEVYRQRTAPSSANAKSCKLYCSLSSKCTAQISGHIAECVIAIVYHMFNS